MQVGGLDASPVDGDSVDGLAGAPAVVQHAGRHPAIDRSIGGAGVCAAPVGPPAVDRGPGQVRFKISNVADFSNVVLDR